MTSLEGIIEVVKDYPFEEPRQKIVTMKVPNRISKEFITTNIGPIFKRHKNLRISSYFTSSILKNSQENKFFSPYECLAMFGGLELQKELQESVYLMVRTLQHLGSNGKFIAVDLEDADQVMKNNCHKNFTMNKCYDGKEIGQFLRKIGFERDTIIYLTQSGRNDKSLISLRRYFPNTFTKVDSLISSTRNNYFYFLIWIIMMSKSLWMPSTILYIQFLFYLIILVNNF